MQFRSIRTFITLCSHRHPPPQLSRDRKLCPPSRRTPHPSLPPPAQAPPSTSCPSDFFLYSKVLGYPGYSVCLFMTLMSLSLLSSRFVHVIAYARMSFSRLNNVPLYTYRSYFAYPASVNTHSDCPHILALVNTAVVIADTISSKPRFLSFRV